MKRHRTKETESGGPYLVVLVQNLKGKGTPVHAQIAENATEAMAIAKHYVLEKSPPNLRCNPDFDSIGVYDLSLSPCEDILTESECEEWRRQAGVFQGPRRKRRQDGTPDEDDDDTKELLVKGDLKVVDFRNDGE